MNRGSWGQISKRRHKAVPALSPVSSPWREDGCRGLLPPSEPRAAQCGVADSRRYGGLERWQSLEGSEPEAVMPVPEWLPSLLPEHPALPVFSAKQEL